MTKILLKINCGDSNPLGLAENRPFLENISSHPFSLNILLFVFKSVSMRKPGRTRQEVIQLKSPILLKLGTNVGFGE